MLLRKEIEEVRRARDGVTVQLAEKDQGLEQVRRGSGYEAMGLWGFGMTCAAESRVWCSIEWRGRCWRAELARQRAC